MIGCSSIVIFLVILCLIRRFTANITGPIEKLTEFTTTLTTATDFKEKQKRIEDMKIHPFFEEILDEF